ncbi:MAG: hypothetical protein BJ554DRAFT_5069, partial [Olpidium bornovanus]
TTRGTPVDAAPPEGRPELGDGERFSSESENDDSDELSVDEEDDRRRRRRRHLDEALVERGADAPLSEASQLLLSKESIDSRGGSRVLAVRLEFGTGGQSSGRGGPGGGSGVGRGLFEDEQGKQSGGRSIRASRDGNGGMGRTAGLTGAGDDAAERFDGAMAGGEGAVLVAVTASSAAVVDGKSNGANKDQSAVSKNKLKNKRGSGVATGEMVRQQAVVYCGKPSFGVASVDAVRPVPSRAVTTRGSELLGAGECGGLRGSGGGGCGWWGFPCLALGGKGARGKPFDRRTWREEGGKRSSIGGLQGGLFYWSTPGFRGRPLDPAAASALRPPLALCSAPFFRRPLPCACLRPLPFALFFF